MYLYGQGVTEDAVEAVNWYRLAAEQGMPEAQINLGARYDKGDGIKQDDVMAYTWLNLAAKQGNEEAIKALETLAWRMSFQQKEIAKQLTEACEAKNLKGCE
jgi:TPR repeat protein